MWPRPDILRPLEDRPLLDPGQPLAVLVEIDQSKAGANPFVILLQAAIANFSEAEDALQYAKRPLHLGSHSRLSPVLSLLLFIHPGLGLDSLAGHVLCLGRNRVDSFGLPLITRVAPDLLLVPMQ